MKTKIIAACLIISTPAMAEPDDLVLDIDKWDQDKAKTVSGWFANSEKVREIKVAVADSAPTRKAIDVARIYLSNTFPELGEADLIAGPNDPLHADNREKVKSWDFIEMTIHPIDFGRGRGTLMSWKAEDSGLFYYALKFRPRLESNATTQSKTVVLLPNLEVVPYRTLPATESEQKQIVWWERHLGHQKSSNKETLPQSDSK